MRLFIAIPMPKAVGEELKKLQQPIEGVRWEQKNKYHLTLKFLGDTEPQKLEDLQAALEDINFSIFSIMIEGIWHFPRRGSPRVLWAGIRKNHPLQELQQTIEYLCTDLGFDPEQRSFKPHVTIGRIKEASRNEITSFIKEYENFIIEDIRVSEVVLFESKLHPDGARHIPKKEISLTSQ